MKRSLAAALGLGLLYATSAGAQPPAASPAPTKPEGQEDVVKREEVVVVTASKVETTLVNAPATVSVVTADTIAASPAQNYGDLLRSVPGVNVIQMSARDINLTSRQATATLSNSQLALLDGRSIYVDFFGFVLWDFIPTVPSDIKQIEVVRGPASAVWGANALTGVVNIITKTPREAVGTNLVLSGGLVDRDAGSTVGQGMGTNYGASFSFAQAPNDRWSYKILAGYFNSEPLPRPVGRIPLIADPRLPARSTPCTAPGNGCVGGGTFPVDAEVLLFGTGFRNEGTSQPKFDLRIDQELGNGGRVTYAAGGSGSQGIVHTGIGPFDIQNGSWAGYGKINYSRGGLKVNAFANLIDSEAPNLLLPDPATLQPLQLNFKTQTFDFEIGNSHVIAGKHILTYGGNARRNNFDITIAANSEDRNEFGAYFQDEIFFEKFRFALGARVDKFGNLEDPVFSPRLTAMFKPTPAHSLRASFNRAFRSPSTINNYLDVQIFAPGGVNLSGLAPLLPPPLRPAVAVPFPLVVRAVGNKVGPTALLHDLKEESVTAYEIGYTGSFNGRTTLGAAFYINDTDDNINFAQLPASADPYTAANPPPGWVQRGLPPSLLSTLAALPPALGGPIFLPRTAFTYLNLGPLRNKGVELSVDHAFNGSWTAFANYSYQADPEAISDSNPFPAGELALPPTNRFNVGLNFNDKRFLGSFSVNYSDEAFWSDVLTDPFFGFTDSYTLVNASFGVKWSDGKVITAIKATNLTNKDINQHIFGDILKRSLVGEVRIRL